MHERRRAWHRNDARAMIALLIVLVGVLLLTTAYSQLEALRRTADAEVTFEKQFFQPGSVLPDTPQGHYLRYSYVVDGVSYAGATFRRWTNVEAHEPKICYDPNHPSDHLLVDGSHRCGT